MRKRHVGCRFFGKSALSYEMEDTGPGGSQDILSSVGFMYAMSIAFRTYFKVLHSVHGNL